MRKISIIIPIYNVEKYLEECLNSILNQPFNNIEIICIDDCSTDNSLSIANNYAQKDNRINIIKNSTNIGLARTRNIGINNSKGDYILFIDSDDIMEENILEKLYNKAILTNADVVFATNKAFKSDELDNNCYLEEKIEEYNSYFDTSKKEDRIVNNTNFRQILCNNIATAWGKLYKKSFLIDNNIQFINQNVAFEDEGFWLKICSVYPRIAYIPDVAINYRLRKYSIISEIKNNPKKKKYNLKIVLNDAFKYIKDNHDKNTAKFMIENIKSYDMYNFNSPIKMKLKNFIKNFGKLLRQ